MERRLAVGGALWCAHPFSNLCIYKYILRMFETQWKPILLFFLLVAYSQWSILSIYRVCVMLWMKAQERNRRHFSHDLPNSVKIDQSTFITLINHLNLLSTRKLNAISNNIELLTTNCIPNQYVVMWKFV